MTKIRIPLTENEKYTILKHLLPKIIGDITASAENQITTVVQSLKDYSEEESVKVNFTCLIELNMKDLIKAEEERKSRLGRLYE